MSTPGTVLRCIRADNPSPMTLDGTRTYVVGRERVVVIDPGPDDSTHLRTVRATVGDGDATIVLTHAHTDHAAGAGSLARMLGAPVAMGPGALSDVAAPAVDRWLAHDDRVECDAGEMVVLRTPGHAPEHISLLWRGPAAPPAGALFAGDLFMGEGDTTLVAPPEGDLGDYLRSLDLVERVGPGMIYPAHGPAIADPREAVARYRDHRIVRIRSVRRALRLVPDAEPDDLVDAVYGAALEPSLRAAAAGSIRSVLDYLAAVSGQ